LDASGERTSKHRFKQAQNEILSMIVSILEIVLGSVLKIVLKAVLGVCNKVYWPVLLNAAGCIVLSAQHCMHIIVM
jgi:hypothetical protein